MDQSLVQEYEQKRDNVLLAWEQLGQTPKETWEELCGKRIFMVKSAKDETFALNLDLYNEKVTGASLMVAARAGDKARYEAEGIKICEVTTPSYTLEAMQEHQEIGPALEGQWDVFIFLLYEELSKGHTNLLEISALFPDATIYTLNRFGDLVALDHVPRYLECYHAYHDFCQDIYDTYIDKDPMA